MKKYLVIISVVLIGAMTSCGSIDLLNYDQLIPAEVFLPSQIKEVGVVNNMPARSASKNDILTLGLLEGEGEKCSEELAGVLADSKFFDAVVLADSALQNQQRGSNDYGAQLSMSQVNTLTKQLGVDLLVSFEQLWVETSKKELKYPGWDAYLQTLEAKVTPVVRLYVANRTQPMLTISLTDSLYWGENVGVSEKQILDEAASFAAKKVADKMIPAWEPTERLYFVGGCVEMRDAAVLVGEDDWNEAQKVWKGLFDRLQKGKTKAKAAFNIALSYEMLGNIEEAQKWLSEAKKYVRERSEEEYMIKLYTDTLSERKKQLSSLNMQMNRFTDNF